ncbi:MAG: NAD(P)-dependent alcohol dehydrogenase [Chloracidobacterium sp.]|nr:NAD(P)-dependent alcohol dehydrogenase [Chloracidobacterium sp.]MDW8217446.1 NAD(P)-dependent alcohol dehydrogenase [Acidobacteriota bacterium]
MKCVEIAEKFGIEHLTVKERPHPELGYGEVLVRVRAASLNFRDLMTVTGVYNPKQPLPLIPLSDGVGEIVAVGDGVTRVAVGDRVAGIFAQGWIAGEPSIEKIRGTTLGGPLDGMLAEYRALSQEGVVKVPDYLNDEEAATLPCAALTAWSALITHGQLKPGDTVLVQGTGGVSIFALQFAKAAGARVIITSGSDEKLERAKALGADEIINYKQAPDWDKAVREMTGGRGVDHVVEVGGIGTLAKAIRSVRFGGQISLIGVLSGRTGEVDIAPILMQNIRVQGIIVGSREMFEAMNRALEQNRIRPVVDKIFPLEETQQAFQLMAQGGHFGKICIRLD